MVSQLHHCSMLVSLGSRFPGGVKFAGNIFKVNICEKEAGLDRKRNLSVMQTQQYFFSQMLRNSGAEMDCQNCSMLGRNGWAFITTSIRPGPLTEGVV